MPFAFTSYGAFSKFSVCPPEFLRVKNSSDFPLKVLNSLNHLSSDKK